LKRKLLVVVTLSGLAMAACDGCSNAMGYRWPDTGIWETRVVPPKIVDVEEAAKKDGRTVRLVMILPRR
jgi:hypothetical protein